MTKALLLALVACSPVDRASLAHAACPPYEARGGGSVYAEARDAGYFTVRPDMVTPDGTLVDTSGHAVDLEKLDAKRREIEARGVTVRACGYVVKVATPGEIGRVLPGAVGLNQRTATAVVPADADVLPHEVCHLIYDSSSLYANPHCDPLFVRCSGEPCR